MDKTLLQITGSAVPVFIQLCSLVLIYEVVQFLQNFSGMSDFNRTINSVLRECTEIDSQFLFFILSKDGSSSQPPGEISQSLGKIQAAFTSTKGLEVCIYFIRRKNQSLLLQLTDFKQVDSSQQYSKSPKVPVTFYHFQKFPTFLTIIPTNHFLLHSEWKPTLKNSAGRKTAPVTGAPNFRCHWTLQIPPRH